VAKGNRKGQVCLKNGFGGNLPGSLEKLDGQVVDGLAGVDANRGLGLIAPRLNQRSENQADALFHGHREKPRASDQEHGR
jgi:hypothetical protein